MGNKLFDIGGIFLILSGAFIFTLWIISFLEFFGPNNGLEVFMPSYQMLTTGTVLEIVQKIVLTVLNIVFAFGLMISGWTFVKIKSLWDRERPTDEELEGKVNRLQDLIWRILQKMKEQ